MFREALRSSLLSDPKYMKKLADSEKKIKERNSRMKYGKNWKQFTSDAKSAKERLRPGEFKKYDPVLKKYVSNKD